MNEDRCSEKTEGRRVVASESRLEPKGQSRREAAHPIRRGSRRIHSSVNLLNQVGPDCAVDGGRDEDAS